jgi:hypothetical protein
VVGFNEVSRQRALRIHCFGASVTAQATNHATGEQTGYAQNLKNLLEKDFPDLDFIVTAAGSSHFDQAGYCLLPEVLKSNPDILILDWHTTGLGEFNNQLWLAAIQQIKDSGIIALIALFPRRDDFENRTERPNIKQARDCAGGCIKLVDQAIFSDLKPEVHLRDVVHTTSAGGIFYAEILAEIIKNSLLGSNDKVRPKNPGENMGSQPLIKLPSVSKYKYSSGDDFISCQNVSIEFQGDNTIETPSLILDHKIGPYSPVVELSLDGGRERLISLWDPWCYFTRQTYTGIPISGCSHGAHRVAISATDKPPAHEESRDAKFDFTLYSKRYMNIRSVYCIGGKIISLCFDPA